MKRQNLPYRVYEAPIRGTALQVFILAVVAAYTSYAPILVFIAADFALRAFISPRLSPLAFFSRTVIAKNIPFRKRMIVFKPKRFAAGIGFFMSAGALFFLFLQPGYLSVLICSVLALFSFLEAFFKFCAGCKIFGLLIKLGILKEEECPDCVYINGSGI